MDGNVVKAGDMDLCVRAISVGALHKAYPMTVAVATGAAAKIPGPLSVISWESITVTVSGWVTPAGSPMC